jgi:hypothetical protein
MTERTLGTFRIDKSQWEAFQGKAKENGSNASSLILSWIELYLDGNLDSIDKVKSCLDDSIDSIDNRIDKRVEERLQPIRERIDELMKELGEFAA